MKLVMKDATQDQIKPLIKDFFDQNTIHLVMSWLIL